METRANFILVGAFTLLGFFGIMAFLLWFADYRMNRQTAYYDSFFTQVSGVGLGAEVRFAGLKVGQVVDMRIAPEQGGVRVRLEVAAGTPVKTDSTALIEPQGVTGVSFVGITAGSPGAALLMDESDGIPVIRAGESALQTLGTQGPEIIENLNAITGQLKQLLGDENQRRVDSILRNVERSTDNLDQAVADVSAATQGIAEVAKGLSDFAGRIDGLADAAQTTLGNADAMLGRFNETAAHADQTLQSGTAALDEVRAYVAGDLAELTTSIRDGAERVTALADRASGTLEGVDRAIETGQGALTAAESAFQGADRAINEDLGPVVADLRQSLQGLNRVVETLEADLPDISARVRSAAESARIAFAQFAALAAETRVPVAQFASSGLLEITRAAREVAAMSRSVDQAVTLLQRRFR